MEILQKRMRVIIEILLLCIEHVKIVAFRFSLCKMQTREEEKYRYNSRFEMESYIVVSIALTLKNGAICRSSRSRDRALRSYRLSSFSSAFPSFHLAAYLSWHPNVIFHPHFIRKIYIFIYRVYIYIYFFFIYIHFAYILFYYINF